MRPITLVAALALAALGALGAASGCGGTDDCYVDGECKLTCKTDPRKSDAQCDNECTQCVEPQAAPTAEPHLDGTNDA